MTIPNEVADQLEGAIELRRNRQHPYIGTGRCDLAKNVRPGEFPIRASARQTETLERLSAPVFRIDEIALEVCREDARRRRSRSGTAFPYGSKQPAKDRW